MRLQASVLPGLVAGVYRERLFGFAQTGGRFRWTSRHCTTASRRPTTAECGAN